MKRNALLAAAAVLVSPSLAAADVSVYASAGYANYELGSFDNMGGATGRLGVRTRHFGVEGEAAISLLEGDGGGLDAEIDSAAGVFAVGFLPVGERWELIGRVGQFNMDVGASGSCGAGCTVTASLEDDGVAYGAGLQYRISERFGVRADYTHLDGKLNEGSMIGLSGVMRF